VDEHGFAGQVGVLIYLTMLFWIIFSAVFGVLLYRRNRDMHVQKVEVDSSDYVMADEKEEPTTV
jgi:hypothetical protein